MEDNTYQKTDQSVDQKRKQNRIRKNRMAVRGLLAALMLTAGSGILGGCRAAGSDQVKVVLTTGFAKDEVFRIEDLSCHLPELMIYLTNTQNQYENVYGPEIWKASAGEVTLEQNVKDTTLARLARIKTMNLLAREHGIALTEQEAGKASEAAAAYMASLNEKEKELLDAGEELLTQLYQEYALANKVYHYIIRDINPEISDDEARTIRIQHILLKTYTMDGNGNRVECTEDSRRDTREAAVKILTKAQQGEDFEALMEKYDNYSCGSLAFGKGEMDPALEEAAFRLGNDECTMAETPDGFYVIKCISTFDREETDANKIKIMEKRKKEVFEQEYDTFVSNLTRTQNAGLWKEVELIRDDQVTTSAFFEIYDQYFDAVSLEG